MVILCSALVGIKVRELDSQGKSESFRKASQTSLDLYPSQPEIKLLT